MPYFRITIRLKKKRIIGIRELSNPDIDFAWRYFEKKTFEKFSRSDVLLFEVVMISKLSEDARHYLKKPKRPFIQ